MNNDLNKTKEQLASELNDLRKKNKIRQEIQDAAKQQLRATEQQLIAANQQLGANNQQLRATEQQLIAANQQLGANNQQLLATEQQLTTSNKQLIERIKELDCFYGISKIVEIPDISLEEIFQKTVNLIPDSWQYPEIAVCRIIFNGIEYKTHNFKKTNWCQCSEIFIDGKNIGNIEVCYLKKMPDSDDGPFLKEERLLLDALAKQLEKIIERLKAEENQRAANQQLEANNQQLIASEQQLKASNQQLDTSNQQLAANEQQLRAANQQLTANEQQLRAANQQLYASEQEIKKHVHNLGERVKELNCFHEIAESVRTSETLEEILQDVVNFIPPTWQYPEITCAKISFEKTEYKTDNYEESKWKLCSDIIVKRKIEGKIEVCYLEQISQNNIEPFLKEERILLDNITERLGRIIERNNAEEELKTTNRQLEANNQQLSASEQQLKAANQQLDAFNQQLQANEQQLQAANQQLVVSETKYRKISENTPAVVYQFEMTPDGDFTFPYVNDSAKNILGANANDIINDSSILINKVHPDDQQMFLDGVMKSAKTFEIYHETFRYLKNGDIIWLECRTSPNLKKNGNILWDGFLIDITERKQAEEKLKNSESALQEAQKIANIGSWEMDAVTKKLTWSDQLYHQLEVCTDEEPTFELYFSRVHPDDLEFAQKEGAKLYENNETRQVDYKLLTPSGKTKFISTDGQQVLDKSGKVLKLSGIVHDITERKKAEAAMRMSEEKYSVLSDNMIVGLVLHNANTEIIFSNPAASNILGLSKEQLLGKSAIDSTWSFCQKDGSILPSAEFPVNKVVATNESLNDYIIGIKVPDRDFISWVSVNATPVFDKKKSLSYVTITFSDITKRKQAEEKQRAANQQLAASEQQLRAANQQLIASEHELKKEKNFSERIVETANAIIIGLDKDHIIRIFNKGAEDITGYTKAEVIGKDWFKIFLHTNMLDEINKVWRNAWGIASHSYVNAILSKTGKEIIVSWQNTGIYESEDVSEHLLISIGEDITERKQAEEALRESEEKLNLIINTSPIGICTVDLRGNFVTTNLAYEKMLGYSKEELKELSFFDVTHPDNRPTNKKLFQNMFTLETASFSMKKKYIRKDGSEIDVAVHAVGIMDAEENIRFGTAFIEDITASKQMEEALKESERKFRSLFSEMTEGVYLHEMIYNQKGEAVNYRIIETNHASEKQLNIKKEDATGKLATELYGLEEAPYLDIYAKVAETSIPYHFEEYFPLMKKYFHISVYSPKKGTFATVFTDITEGKLAEEALRRSEKRLSLIYNSTSENMSLIKVETPSTYRMVSFNDEYFQTVRNIYGEVSREQLLNHTTKELKELLGWSDSLFDNTIRNYLKVIETGKSVKTVDELRTPRATLFLETVYFPVFNNEKICTHILYTSRDITDSKKTTKALLKNKQKFESLILNSPDLLMIQDIDGSLKYISPQCEKILGYTTEEIKNNNFQKLVHPDDLESTKIRHKSALSGGELNNFEYRFFKKNGSLVWLDHTARPIIIDGEITEIISTVRDITERKRNEQIQKIIHNISNAANTSHNIEEFIKFIKEELGTIIDTKNFYITLYDDKIKTISILYHKDQKDTLKEFPQGKSLTSYIIKTKKPLLATKAVKDKLVKSGEIELLGNNSKIWLGIPLMIKEKVIGAFAVQSYSNKNAFNETDMQVLEIISNQISISIERKKAEENLISALEKAQESDRLKSAFLTNMSHEIRTPMNGILGFTELLKEPQLTGDEQKSYIKIIEKSGARMLNTINDIIDISRIEAGQIEVVKTEVSVSKILEEQYNFFDREAKAKGLELIYNPALSDKDALIVSDKQKLESILTNLIKNAIKFTKNGNISFGCLLKKEKNFNGLEFYVKDSGIGIPSDRINAIFNRFEQADIEDSQVFEGSGLGLAISKSYVKMLGGNIRVTSEEGIGSTFVFSIPYTKQSIKESNTEGITNTNQQVSLKNLSVIIAEDDEDSHLLLEAIFQNKFKKITFTETGKETLEKFQENPETNIILMDLKMPVMSGYEATREIRKFNKDVIIIAQTAYGLSGDKEKAIEAGCDDYIAKPIIKEMLFEKLMFHLAKKSV